MILLDGISNKIDLKQSNVFSRGMTWTYLTKLNQNFTSPAMLAQAGNRMALIYQMFAEKVSKFEGYHGNF